MKTPPAAGTRHTDSQRSVSALRGHTLRSITPGDVERYVAGRIGMVAPASVNRELAFLKRVFKVAIADGIAETNPVTKVKFLRERNRRTRFLTEDEETSLRKAIGEEHWPPVLVALHTGLRQGEEFRLRWDDVDFATNIITVSDGKSGDRRHIPMNDTLRECLAALESRLTSSWVFPSTTSATALDPKNFLNRVWLPAVKRIQLANFRWHDLRHTFASRLVARGTDILRVKELLGHRTLAMTLRYAHLAPGHLHEAVQRLVPERTGTTTGTSEEHTEPAVSSRRVSVGTRVGKKWPGTESNHRHRDFQSRALPTELPGRGDANH